MRSGCWGPQRRALAPAPIQARKRSRIDMSHSLKCSCGRVKGVIADAVVANHGVCYCRDCQAFAHFLGRPREILDERGGSDIVQVLPRWVTFTAGIGSLACMRLTPKGLLRWYAPCCNTPIGNTLATPKV